MFIEEKELIDDQIRALNMDSIMLLDDRLDENYTINFVLDKPEWRKLYEKLTCEFEKSDSGLYVYPFERLHMTLLGRIDKRIDENRIVETLKGNLVGKTLVFKVGYLACNELGVSAVSEPEFDLAELRNKIRKDLDIKGDDYTKYLPIYERLGWFNFIRFQDYPGEKFFETLWNMRDYQFGEFEARDVDIYLNTSRTMDPEKCKLIEKVTF
ncbi:MAG: hypothetical protein UX08_C0004G0036 [Candidatus Collierbacteria bacterium GW2011_GWB1_45_35]|uniref:DUF1868 domain-containing protein n=2 Tax=Candidatus Collieribacteriota TaxID=1752725 RepID=A0A0G1KR47_9BACT|nr:MAG: hypothetical protein UW48_C0002G0064 [Microgenomates group bacterium GW2011_GWC1_44_23]KKT86048.1 MAG: hypothetical protein UW84_C0017G0015 [Candidatus Collierbacteria bacterium GW2011_GWA2_44_99]KKT95628.1 MAG: hypothetical protein UW96_C0006G0059 [Candidatus Collierbacteria bacterium GW2011_GWA1_45_15]KKU00472.1 MAG: hypothetical protein UX01_C0004G0039 [Candidatus Collierbacteria bacterium GW2011_GWB2_45_17]KKU05573.1 MAG: hypothetical protein UX08_C0004G0036 [Candidatus Collierbacte